MTDRAGLRRARGSTIEARLARTLEAVARSKDITGVVVRVERAHDGFAWTGAAGKIAADRPFFIASTTKLYTTAIVLRLVERGALALDTLLVDRVEPELVRGLHVIRGINHTDRITVRHLLAHTSGLPDYFMGKDGSGASLEHRLRRGIDSSWTTEDAVEIARRMTPAFTPGRPGKARYSDTNFQLLGRVIEGVTKFSYTDALQSEVLEPLGLEHTWLYDDPDDGRPVPLRDGSHELRIPRAMTSFGPDGGVAATVEDLMRFLRAFFEGRLFDRAALDGLRTWNRIFFPLQYGVGLARFQWPRIFSPFAAQPELLGHSGLSGAFAFWAPERDTYVAGTVNNIARPDRSFRLMLRLLEDVRAGA